MPASRGGNGPVGPSGEEGESLLVDAGKSPFHEIGIRGIGAGGVGVGDLSDGRVVFVPRTAPGDRVRVSLTREKERFAVARLEELVEGGPHRRTPPCSLYHRCGGCALQHLAYPRQLHWKGRVAGDALRRIGGLEVEDPKVEPSPSELRYRNKVSLTLRRLARGGVVAGFHELERASRILDVRHQCLLPIEPLADLWTQLREGWGAGASLLPGGRELRLTLRGLGSGGSLIIKGGRGDGNPPGLLEAVPGLSSIWRDQGQEGLRHLAGGRTFEMAWFEKSVEVAGDAFVQVNPEAGQALHRFVLDRIRELAPSTVVEGYCGAGTMGRTLAREGAKVTGIELDPLSVAEARRGAPWDFRVVEGRVEDHLPALLPADLVLLNPPRRGLSREIPSRLLESGPPGLVYVSCDPATLARDLRGLREGYHLRTLQSFDLFPQTGHVETVAILRRGGE